MQALLEVAVGFAGCAIEYMTSGHLSSGTASGFRQELQTLTNKYQLGRLADVAANELVCSFACFALFQHN